VWPSGFDQSIVLILLSVQATARYFEQLKDFQLLLHQKSTNPIKVVILDTGVDLPTGMPNWLREPRYESYSWMGMDDDDGTQNPRPKGGQGDPDGHGTHMASIVLDIARNCKLYIVQVAGERKAILGKEANDAVAANIARVSCQSSKNMIMQLTKH
jgi:hypothetical protein